MPASLQDNTSGDTFFFATVTLGTTKTSSSVVVGVDGPDVLRFGGAVLGMGGLTKVGGGVLLLFGTDPNTYAGVTRVNAGDLYLDKSSGATAIPHKLIVGDGLGGAQADAVIWDASEQIADTAKVILNGSGLLDLEGYGGPGDPTFTETIHALTNNGGVVNPLADLIIV